MNCPRCDASKIRKFGHQDGKQRFKCNECGRIWRASSTQRGYSPEVKQLCIKMYLNGMGFRGIERVTEIHHTTIIDWVRESSAQLPEDEATEPPKHCGTRRTANLCRQQKAEGLALDSTQSLSTRNFSHNGWR